MLVYQPLSKRTPSQIVYMTHAQFGFGTEIKKFYMNFAHAHSRIPTESHCDHVDSTMCTRKIDHKELAQIELTKSDASEQSSERLFTQINEKVEMDSYRCHFGIVAM